MKESYLDFEANQEMINEHNNSPLVNEHLKLHIKIVQNAPYTDKLEALLKLKEREKMQAIDIADTQTLVAEEI